ncbi:MAG: arginine--tRNA ligase [Candidatus Melainabacteria bacterium]
MIKQRLADEVMRALTAAADGLNDLDVAAVPAGQLVVERPRNADHGDFAVNVSPLARQTRMAPPQIAETVAGALTRQSAQTGDDASPEVSVVAGFVNFTLPSRWLAEALHGVLTASEPGANASMADQRVLLEYVSANPTGPLHVGHGRWAALGDSLVRLMRHCGALVTPEFYINDAGEQMHKIARSVYIRMLEQLGQPTAALGDPPYPGDYVAVLAAELLADPAMKSSLTSAAASVEEGLFPDLKWLIPPLRDRMLAQQQALLNRLGVTFDVWFSEQEDLYDQDLPRRVLEKLRATGMVREEDNAIWFESSRYGDEKDRVLKKTDGSLTYFTPDIAYHDQKFNRTAPGAQAPYNRFINIWGADHHGYIPRMRAALNALGHIHDEGKTQDPRFEVILGQLVNLIIDGEKTRMGKRRKMLTLEDVVDEVGVDATRFWMVSKSADTGLDFDVDLAMSATNENPVYYVQYAHARCASILRNATESHTHPETGETVAAVLPAGELAAFAANLTPDDLLALWEGLDDAKALQSLKELVLRLDAFGDVVADAAKIRSPHIVARYLLDLAADFHSFYNQCRIITPDVKTTRVRLMLIRALQRTLAAGLALLGVSAPERM